jgi:hypothetical protein
MASFIDNYINSDDFKRLSGHPYEQTYKIVEYLSHFSAAEGGAMEIGVEHGKFFIGINSLVPSHFKSYAVDIFGETDLTKDNGAYTTKEIFINNITQLDLHKGKNVQIIQGDSTNKDLYKGMKKSHIISIDGAHYVEYVLNDLQVANNLLTDRGFVIVDDFLWPTWVSIIEALVLYLYKKPTLVPFAFGFNKMYMCKIGQKDKYKEYVKSMPGINKIEVEFCGHKIFYLY